MNFLLLLFVFLAFHHANAAIFKFREEYAEFDGDTKTLDLKMSEVISWQGPKPPKKLEDSDKNRPKMLMPKKHKKQDNLGIGFLVEGIEQSDFGRSELSSDFQRSRPANGFVQCLASEAPSMLKLFYQSQPNPDNYLPEAIRAICYASGGMSNFCACDEAGTCYKADPMKPPVYVEMAPYCDPREGCHVYLELYQGQLRAESNPSRIYTHRFDAGPFGFGSPYMKVSAVSCQGCARIGKALRKRECQLGEFVKNAMDAQDLKPMLGQ